MKLTPTLGGAYSGSFGGLTAGHGPGGSYLRRRRVPTDPASGFQSTVRDAFGGLSQAWVDTLTDEQRLGWDTYGQNVSWTDALGQSIQLSGISHFIRSNTPRRQATVQSAGTFADILDAPTSFELGLTPSVTSVDFLVNPGPPFLVAVDLEVTNVVGGTSIFAFVSPPQNPSVTFFKGPYILAAADAASDPVSINLFAPSLYTDRYPGPQAGQALSGYLLQSHPDGRLSSPGRWGPSIVPAS